MKQVGTSAGADVYARIRPGTDAAFLNTMINHIVANGLYDEDFVITHTNALFLIQPDFDFKDGLFSGFDEAAHKYDTKTWGYQLDGTGTLRVHSLVSRNRVPSAARLTGFRERLE